MCLQLLEASRCVLTTKEEMDFWQQITTDLSDEKDDTVEGEAGWIVRPPSFCSQELSNLCRRLWEELEGNPNYVATHRKWLRDLRRLNMILCRKETFQKALGIALHLHAEDSPLLLF